MSVPLTGMWKRQKGGKPTLKGVPPSQRGQHPFCALLSVLIRAPGTEGDPSPSFPNSMAQGTQGAEAAAGLNPGLSGVKALSLSSHCSQQKAECSVDL